MDKKVLAGFVNDIVVDVQKKLALEDGEARTLVGIALRKNKLAIVESIANPALVLAPAPVVAS